MHVWAVQWRKLLRRWEQIGISAWHRVWSENAEISSHRPEQSTHFIEEIQGVSEQCVREARAPVIANNPDLLTKLKASIRSVNATHRVIARCIFSWSFFNVNTASMVKHHERRPHWFPSRTLSEVTCSLGRNTRDKSFPAPPSSEIPR